MGLLWFLRTAPLGFYHGVGGDPAHPRPHPGPGAAGQTPGKSRQIAGEGVRMFLRVELCPDGIWAGNARFLGWDGGIRRGLGVWVGGLCSHHPHAMRGGNQAVPVGH